MNAKMVTSYKMKYVYQNAHLQTDTWTNQQKGASYVKYHVKIVWQIMKEKIVHLVWMGIFSILKFKILNLFSVYWDALWDIIKVPWQNHNALCAHRTVRNAQHHKNAQSVKTAIF